MTQNLALVRSELLLHQQITHHPNVPGKYINPNSLCTSFIASSRVDPLSLTGNDPQVAGQEDQTEVYNLRALLTAKKELEACKEKKKQAEYAVNCFLSQRRSEVCQSLT